LTEALMSCESKVSPNVDVVCDDRVEREFMGSSGRTDLTISELARELDVTCRTLRFYESKGLISPRRYGRARIYGASDRDRMILILKGKKLGFTLAEIGEMILAKEGRGTPKMLCLTREKCAEQIAFFERQMRDIALALTELRELQATLAADSSERTSKLDGAPRSRGTQSALRSCKNA
jgi:DNA-binding transcriptional MerR regulator